MANYFLDLSFSAAPMFWHIFVLCLRLLLFSIFFLHVCLGICLSFILFSYFWSAVPSTSLSLSFSPSAHLSFFLRLCRSYVIIFSRTRWLSLLPRILVSGTPKHDQQNKASTSTNVAGYIWTE